ncbi:alpha/beta fold hydrolase [Bdellovibrio sp. HCB288]|uniref:alpha/beta fold hydrolase n=1 Tax=Bdellovibrio sp. HCB288 TaxID=3394355 RepID=UPI0039B44A47
MNKSHPLLMIPGLACTSRLYEAQVQAFEKLGPVIIADHRQQDSMEEIAKSILAKAPPQFALIGLSMGGYIAFEIMRQAPERVSKLVLMNTSARPDTAEQTTARKTAIEQTRSGKFTEAMEASLPFILKDFENPELKKIFLKMTQETGPEAFIRQQHAIMERIDSRPSLKNIHCPTLVLAAAEDKLIPEEVMAEIANGIKDAKFISVPNCGHLSTLEQPELTTQILLDWLR